VHPGFPGTLFSRDFSSKRMYAFLTSCRNIKCSVYFVLVVITRIIFREVYVLWRIQRLLLGDAPNMHATIEERCFLCSPYQDCIRKGPTVVDILIPYGRLWRRESVEFCNGGCEDKIWVRKAEESPLLEAFARERLMKTEYAWKRLSGCCGDLWTV
jgi:hypothetical protein